VSSKFDRSELCQDELVGTDNLSKGYNQQRRARREAYFAEQQRRLAERQGTIDFGENIEFVVTSLALLETNRRTGHLEYVSGRANGLEIAVFAGEVLSFDEGRDEPGIFFYKSGNGATVVLPIGHSGDLYRQVENDEVECIRLQGRLLDLSWRGSPTPS
jgi:hypothetical protein